VVPGSGFVLLPASRFAAGPTAVPAIEPDPEPTSVLDTPSPTSVLPIVAAAHAPVEGSPAVAELAEPSAETAPPETAPPEPEPEPVEPGPQGSLNLRAAAALPLPPLPAGVGPGRSMPGAPVVAGILCPRGHMNRPGLTSCVRCASPIPPETAYSVSGARPALGCLIVDDGSVYRLDRGYLIGSRPERDPTVRGNLALPLVVKGEDVSAAHAEICLHDWDVTVVDRASARGTYVFEPGASQWVRLVPYDPKVLKPGTHVAFGQRIITFVTPWIARGGSTSQEMSDTKRGQ
jgi:hypothetical protein